MGGGAWLFYPLLLEETSIMPTQPSSKKCISISLECKTSLWTPKPSLGSYKVIYIVCWWVFFIVERKDRKMGKAC
jgi:hypothetical protein